MSKLSTTKLSSKGQVVIPEEIRNAIGLHTGAQFIVVAEKDVIILKTITTPSLKEFESMISKARKTAKTHGINKQAINEAILEARKK